MKNRIALRPLGRSISICVILLFLSCPLFSIKDQADCLEVVEEIKTLLKSYKSYKGWNADRIVLELSPPINQLKVNSSALTDSCKYYLASALQWRADHGYAKLGLLEDGLEDCEYGLSLIEELGEKNFKEEIGFLYNTVGCYHQLLFNVDESIYYLKEALKLFSELAITNPKRDVDVYNALTNLSITYYFAGDTDRCYSYAKESLDKRKTQKGLLKGKEVLTAHSHLGMAYAYQLKAINCSKNTKEYFEYYKLAFEQMDKCIAGLKKNLIISVYLVDNRETLAKLYIILAEWAKLAYPEKIDMANAYLENSKTYFLYSQKETIAVAGFSKASLKIRSGDIEGALRSIQVGFKNVVRGYSDANFYSNPPLDMNNIMHKVYFLAGLSQKALALNGRYQKTGNIKDLEESLNVSFLGMQLIDSLQLGLPYDFSVENIQTKFQTHYDNAINTCYQLNEILNDSKYIQIAFRIAEKSKGFVVNRSFRKKKLIANLHENSEEWKLLDKEKSILKQLRKYEKRNFILGEKMDFFENNHFDSLSHYRGKHIELQKFIKSNFPKLYANQFEQKVISLKEVQSQLDNQSAFIQYVVSEKHLFVFIITNDPKTTHLIKRSGKEEWETLIPQFTTSLKKGDNQAFKKVSKDLYDTLFVAVKESISSLQINNLVIIPDDILWQIPFEALIEEEARALPIHKLTYLLRAYSISYDFSVTTFFESKLRSLNKKFEYDICGFTAEYLTPKNGSTSRRCADTPLEGASETIKFIEENFKNHFTNERTTVTDFKKKAPLGKVVFLGMHGCEDEEPLLTHILFTKAGEYVSDLTIGELYNITIDVEHIILMACYAGAGKLKEGEGLISIGRAFYYSGVKSLVTPMWSTNDNVVKEIERKYIENLYKKGWSKAKALQEAKLHYLDFYGSAPWSWSNLILFGDTSSLNPN